MLPLRYAFTIPLLRKMDDLFANLGLNEVVSKIKNPLPKWHNLNGAKPIGDGVRLIVGQNNATVARQNLWQLFQGLQLPVEGGLCLSDTVGCLYGQLDLWDIEIHLNLVVIEEHTLVIFVMAILAEKGQGGEVFQECSVAIKQEKVEYAIVNKIVLTSLIPIWIKSQTLLVNITKMIKEKLKLNILKELIKMVYLFLLFVFF